MFDWLNSDGDEILKTVVVIGILLTLIVLGGVAQ
jgi:hypothetical protein